MACGFLGELGSPGSAATSLLSEPSCLLFLGPSLPAHTMMCLLRCVFISFFFPDTGHNLQPFLVGRSATVFLSKLQTRAITTRVDGYCLGTSNNHDDVAELSLQRANREGCAHFSFACQSEWWPCHLATQAGPSLSSLISYQDSRIHSKSYSLCGAAIAVIYGCFTQISCSPIPLSEDCQFHKIATQPQSVSYGKSDKNSLDLACRPEVINYK